MFVFCHTLVHPRILQGQAADLKAGSVYLHPVLGGGAVYGHAKQPVAVQVIYYSPWVSPGHATCVLIGCPLRSQRTDGLGLPAATQLQSSSELISTSESLITCSHWG